MSSCAVSIGTASVVVALTILIATSYTLDGKLGRHAYVSSVVILNQWLTWWTEDTWHEKAQAWIGIYNGIGFASVLAIGELDAIFLHGFGAQALTCILAVLNVTILLSTIRASRTFHSKALNGVIYAPIWWFESQPIGRIMNRFSKDIESIDQRLIPQLFQLVAGVGSLTSTIVIAHRPCWVSPSITSASRSPLTNSTASPLKRLESTGRGPLQSRISETLDGIPTIMAYGREADFESAVGGLLDASNKPTFLRQHAGMSILPAIFRLSESLSINLGHPSHGSHVFIALAMLAHTKAVGSSTQFVLALTYASTLHRELAP
ncbi:ABC transporter type 1, transmembrane domain-containing protein [Boletus reticuloceps]|uniref:ABC transporter type 1, transmembrane domain-containing protein n=1 Tax=Boletus reticuloceps TaxID=495285 RepID=A0A8I2Z2S2_9AGAM|nr:ABC transporter type 1, transmembrane domain-containing protein [Boletus reticuloceps]